MMPMGPTRCQCCVGSKACDQHRGASVVLDRFHPMYRRVPLSVLALPALALLGCSSAVKHLFTSPTVAFRGVSLVSITPLGGRVLVNLIVRNPNPYSLSTS